jgi:lipoyl(octanoyl) transferase
MISSQLSHVTIRYLSLQDYHRCWQAMKKFTDTRTAETGDEIWLLEHPAVFTQGQNGKPEHLLGATSIPVIPTDRGGQITYHGPGQLIVYTLIDVKRRKWNIRELVSRLEQTVIDFLGAHGVSAMAQCKAPGVYVADKKICSLGLRIRRGCAYHGLALNVDMDLTPFDLINPCGYAELEMTQVKTLLPVLTMAAVREEFVEYLRQNLGYNTPLITLEQHHGTEVQPSD